MLAAATMKCSAAWNTSRATLVSTFRPSWSRGTSGTFRTGASNISISCLVPTCRHCDRNVVLCLEVLIHQHRREGHDAFIRNLVAATAKRGLVSGYIFDPRPEIPSDIIAFHEPIADALNRAGARRVRVEARSLESDCLAFVSFER